jgi:hypothetical protein
VDARFEWTKLSREAHAEATAKFGDDYGSDGWSKPLPGTSPGSHFMGECHRRNGCDRASDAVNVLYKEMEPYAETIRNAEITSNEGLRARTLVSIWDCLPMCSSNDGSFDFDNPESHQSLFSGAVAAIGLSGMVDVLQARLDLDATEPRYGAKS